MQRLHSSPIVCLEFSPDGKARSEPTPVFVPIRYAWLSRECVIAVVPIACCMLCADSTQPVRTESADSHHGATAPNAAIAARSDKTNESLLIASCRVVSCCCCSSARSDNTLLVAYPVVLHCCEGGLWQAFAPVDSLRKPLAARSCRSIGRAFSRPLLDHRP
jgi:hypothetical protein